MSCKKCGDYGTVKLRRNDVYCENCFLSNINHKFRACIGKNKSVPANAKILVCLSGGPGSTALLDFINYGVSLESHKKLRVLPVGLHLIGDKDIEENVNITEYVLNMCKKYNFEVHIAHISDYVETTQNLPEANCLPTINTKSVTRFNELSASLSPSARNDILLKAKRALFIRYAKLLQCNFIFTAETTKTLAINLLSNIAIGRGAQVEHDIGYSDTRDQKIKILRPFKDITQEELDSYINIKQLTPIVNKKTEEPSLQMVIGTFINDLQENFPATISTVCKTADKLGDHNEKTLIEKQCVFCEGVLDTKHQLTALEATNFSRLVSAGKFQDLQAENNPDTIESVVYDRYPEHLMFPLHKYLCYTCSRNCAEIKNQELLPNY